VTGKNILTNMTHHPFVLKDGGGILSNAIYVSIMSASI